MNNPEHRHSVIAEVARLRKGRGFAALARALLTVQTGELWRGEGFKSFDEWGKQNVERSRAMLYLYTEIAKYLPGLPEEQMDRLGVGKCRFLAYLAKYFGTLDQEWVQQAEKLDYLGFKRAAERELGKAGSFEKGEFGEWFAFRGMVHAPMNEQGVVFLFGMVSQELGYLVEAVRRPFPDCIAKELVCEKPQSWRRVRIEFEYKTSSYHHSGEEADLIVCWEDDLAERGVKAPLRVLELKSAIRNLPRTLP